MTFSTASAESPADLNDLEITHLAYTADNVDKRYAENKLAYHQAVNKLVEHTFLPNIKNAGRWCWGLWLRLQLQASRRNMFSQMVDAGSSQTVEIKAFVFVSSDLKVKPGDKVICNWLRRQV